MISTCIRLITVLLDGGYTDDGVPDATAAEEFGVGGGVHRRCTDFQNTFNRRQSRRAWKRSGGKKTHTEYLTHPDRGEVPVNQCVHACTQIVHSSFPTRNPRDVTVLSADECECKKKNPSCICRASSYAHCPRPTEYFNGVSGASSACVES